MIKYLPLLFVVSVCYGQDLNPSHFKFIQPKFVVQSTTISRTTTNVNLHWTPSPDTNANGYNLYVGTAPGDYNYPIQLGNVTNATVFGLLSGVDYHFAVTARGSSQFPESTFSPDTGFYTQLVIVIKFPVFGTNLESTHDLSNWNSCAAIFTNGYCYPVISARDSQSWYRLSQ